MGEAIWTNIKAKVPSTWNGPPEPAPYAGRHGIAADATVLGAPWFMGQLANQLGEGPDEEVDADGGFTIWSCSGEGNYGHYDSDVEPILGWMEDHHIPFQYTDDPKYEFTGEWALFDGKDWHTREYDGNSITLTESTWQGWVEAEAPHAADVNRHLVMLVDNHFNGPSLEACSIEHLPEYCPAEDAEEGLDQKEAVL
jgi:hypothetical protein